MNWGYKILVVIVLFILGMMSMVFVAFRQTNEMVDKDYYQRELQYQSLIDASENLAKISSKKLIEVKNQYVELSIPAGARSTFESGEIEFLKTNDQSKDMKLPIKLSNEGIQKFDRKDFSKGVYTARMTWKSDGIPYHRQEKITIDQ